MAWTFKTSKPSSNDRTSLKDTPPNPSKQFHHYGPDSPIYKPTGAILILTRHIGLANIKRPVCEFDFILFLLKIILIWRGDLFSSWVQSSFVTGKINQMFSENSLCFRFKKKVWERPFFPHWSKLEIFLYHPEWPEYINQAALRDSQIHLPLPPES